MNCPASLKRIVILDLACAALWCIAIGLKTAAIMTLNSLWLGVQGISASMLVVQVLGLSQPIFLKLKPRLLTLAWVMQVPGAMVVLLSLLYVAGFISPQQFVVVSVISKMASYPFAVAYGNLFNKLAADEGVDLQWLATVEQTMSSALVGIGTLAAMLFASIMGVKGIIFIGAILIAMAQVIGFLSIAEISRKGW